MSLEKKLNYTFANKQLLELALTHKSANQENNERLEFLGDALLSAIIAEDLHTNLSQFKEGDLSQARAYLVNKQQLFKMAQGIELQDNILVGGSEKHNEQSKQEAILADALEAVFAAIYLDGGWDALKQTVLPLFQTEIAKFAQSGVPQHPKTKLQEWTQAKALELPKYNILKQVGPSHNCSFVVKCAIKGISFTSKGIGASKQIAEEIAARKFLDYIKQEYNE